MAFYFLKEEGRNKNLIPEQSELLIAPTYPQCLAVI
jgi:hypothetical protein